MFSHPALDALRRARERLAQWPMSTLWLAITCELPEDDTLTLCELDEALRARSSHELTGSDACDEIHALLQGLGATIPAPPPTQETPHEGHLLLALAKVEAAHETLTGLRPLLVGDELLSKETTQLLTVVEALSQSLSARLTQRLPTLSVEAAE